MSSKIISFAGAKREDVVYYIAKLLATCDQPILVVDNSYENKLFRSVWINHEDPDIYVRNITYIKNARYKDELTSEFEYTIVYHGNEINKEWWDASENHFIMINFDRFDNEDMKKSIINADVVQTSIIFVDRYSEKVSDRTIVSNLGLDAENIPVVHEVPTDEELARMKIALQYNSLVRVDKLPQSMKKVMTNIYKEITGYTSKQVAKDLFKKAG